MPSTAAKVRAGGQPDYMVLLMDEQGFIADVRNLANSYALNVAITDQNGDQIVSLGNPTPVTSGGTSSYHKVAAATNNADSIKGSVGQLYGVHVYNNKATPVYVKFYDKATAPNPAADTPLLTVGVQAGTERDLSWAFGKAFALGIGIAIVTGITDTDNTAVALSDCVVDVDYK